VYAFKRLPRGRGKPVALRTLPAFAVVLGRRSRSAVVLGDRTDAVVLVVGSGAVVPPPGVVARAAGARLRAVIVRCRPRLLARDCRLGRADSGAEPARERA